MNNKSPAYKSEQIYAAKPAYELDRIVTQLTTSWGNADTTVRLITISSTSAIPNATISFGINTGNPTNFTALGLSPSPEDNGLVAMTAVQVITAQLAFRVWDELIAGSLIESGGAGANITLNYSSATIDNGTYSHPLMYDATLPKAIAADQIWLSANWASNADSGMAIGAYGRTTLMHEIGHALGLSHPGAYNADPGITVTYAANAEFAQDNRQYTLMSYFGGYDSTINAWAQDNTLSTYTYPQTPMVYDIAAIQSLYGADTTTRAGDTIYGYNNNFAADDQEKPIFDFSTNSAPIFTIWDAGGNDELDCSAWNGNQTIDLLPGSYSSVCGLNNNVGIAFNTTIEKAIGGMGNDILIGNSADNILSGGGGNDTIDGSAGIDTAICASWATCTISGNAVSATITDLTGINGTDSLSNIENLTFGTITVSTEAAVNDAPIGEADNNTDNPFIEGGLSVVGDSTVTGNVLSNDTDADSALGLGETQSVQKVNDQPDNVGLAVAGLYGSLTLSADGSYSYILDSTNMAIHALSAGQVFTDTFIYTVADAHGASSAPTTLTISITNNHNAPTLTAFASAVAVGNEDSTVPVTFADLQNQSDAADLDGSVDRFVVTSLSSGSLNIGASAETATAWDALTNNSLDAAHNAYWTPDANANGILNAFTVAAQDNDGLESAAIQATLAIAAVNDAPTLTAFASAVAAGNEDSTVPVTFADLQNQSDAADLDGSVDRFVVTSLSSGSLNIGSSAETATAWDALTNNSLDAAHNAYWTPDANANGILNAFTVAAQDNDGLESSAIQATLAIAAVNDAPTLTAFASAVAVGNEDSTVQVTFADLQNQSDSADLDGSVDRFVITSLSSGSLNIGASAETATAWDALTNNSLDAAHNAYWTPDANANGILNAFTVAAQDNDGLESSAIQATLAIAAVNDAPTLTAFASAVAVGNEDSTVPVTFADLQNQGDAADLDGSVDSFVVTSLSSGSLKIGASAETATAWNALTNNSLDAAHNAYWTPGANANGILNAFTVAAKDNDGLESAAIQATLAIAPVNDAPVVTEPLAITYTDTVFDDIFSPATGSFVAVDVDNDSLIYGISGAVDNGLTVSKASRYGVLTLTKASGTYCFTPNDAAIESLTMNASARFTVTASDSSVTDSKALIINIIQNGNTESNANDVLSGTSGNDKFNGLNGNDMIKGLAGADTMVGGLGNDVYFVDDVGDRVTETSTLSTEIDTIKSSISYQLRANAENLVLMESSASINGTGNGLNNRLAGNTGNNALKGGAGNDLLIGGLGKDTLSGGLGADVFDFKAVTETGATAASCDIVVDFSSGQGDKIDLSDIDANAGIRANNAFSELRVGNHFSGMFDNQGALYFDRSSHIVYGNNDNDPTADFSIRLAGVNSLTTEDFVL